MNELGLLDILSNTNKFYPKLNKSDYELFNCINFDVQEELELPRVLAPKLFLFLLSIIDLNCFH